MQNDTEFFRTNEVIAKDYLLFLKKEGKISLTKQEIEQACQNEADVKRVCEQIDNELGCGKEPFESSYEIYKGQKVSSRRAWEIFCRIIVNEDIPTGDKIWNEFIEEAFIILERNPQSMIMARRGGGKDFLLCLYCTFKQYIILYFEVIGGFNIPSMIESFFDKYREVIDNNEFLAKKKEFNKKNLIWGNKSCKYNKGRIKGITLGSTGRSKHPNFAFLNDIYGREGGNKYTNDDVEKFLTGDIMPIVSRKKARLAIFGTVDNSDDIYHKEAVDQDGKYKRSLMLCTRPTIFISKKGWAVRIYPGILDWQNKKVFLPNIYTWAQLMNEKSRMGDYQFYKEIQNEIKIDKSGLISRYLFDKHLDDDEHLAEGWEEGYKYYMAVDPSRGEGEYSDYSAICVIGVKKGKKVLKYIWHERMLPIIDPNGKGVDLLNKVSYVFNSFKKPELFIENNSIGSILIQALRKNNIDPYEHNTKEEKAQMVMDVIRNSFGKEKEEFSIPNDPKDSLTQEDIPEFKKEATNYVLKEVRGKLTAGGKGTHDDLMSAFLICMNYVQITETELASAICQD